MTAPTPLDRAHAAMTAGGEAEARQFYRLLADATLFLLLEEEPEGERISPRVFDLEAGPVLLAYDLEDRLAVLSEEGALPYAALPGRIIAQHLAGQGVSLGLNFGSGAPSETMLPPEALRWLAEMLEGTPESVEARPEAFAAPHALPEELELALRFTLDGAAGLASAALLVGVRYEGGRHGHMLAVLDAPPEAEDALARAIGEALSFSGLEAGELDVTFLPSADPSVPGLARVAQVFEIPLLQEPAAAAPYVPEAPGSNPDKPPRLK